MLKVELRSLECEDLILKERGSAQSLGIDLEPKLSLDPLEVYCELSKSEDLISASGWVEGTMVLACDRCLREFENHYKSYFEVLYRPHRDEEDPEGTGVFPGEQCEIVYFQGDLLDVAEQVRQTVLLTVPMRALCREDCRGFCGGCGADLNKEKCRCAEPPPDERWSALKGWKPK